jgi:hypothetical protein
MKVSLVAASAFALLMFGSACSSSGHSGGVTAKLDSTSYLSGTNPAFLAYLTLTNASGKEFEDQPTSCLEATLDNGTVVGQPYAGLPGVDDPVLSNVDLMPGQSTSGYIPLVIPKGARVTKLTLSLGCASDLRQRVSRVIWNIGS